MRRLTATLLLASATAVALSGCIFVRPTPTDPQVPPTNGAIQDCTGEDFTITGIGKYTVRGDCGVVTVTGTDVVIEGDAFAGIEITGDRVQIDADDVGPISIAGNDNELDVDAAGEIAIRGDRNIIDADAASEVTVQGNDNTIDADIIGEVVDAGDRNLIGRR